MSNNSIPHPEIAVPINEGRCNSLIRNCRGITEEGEECDYQYNTFEEISCPECDTPRKRCANHPSVKGKNGRCRFHGGNSPSGLAHYNYQGKGWSKNLPARLLEYYQDSMNDPELLNFAPSISLLNMRREDLLSRLNKDAAYTVWEKLRLAYSRFAKARRSGNKPGAAQEMSDALEEMEELILKGATEGLIWREVLVVEEQLRKARLAEIKRRQIAETVISESQFKELLGFIVMSIQTRVKNEDDRMAVLGDISSLRL